MVANAFDRRAQPGTPGAQARILVNEMQESINSLEVMRKYANEKGYVHTDKYLSDMLSSFTQLSKKFLRAEYKESTSQVEAVKELLKARNNYVNTEISDILTSLRPSNLQDTYGYFNDLKRKKFETLIEQVGNFVEKLNINTNENKNAKNSPQFFSTKPTPNQPFPQVAFAGKLKSSK